MTVYSLMGHNPNKYYYALGDFNPRDHGQYGCWNGFAFVDDINFPYRPLPEEQIRNKEKRIYKLQEDIKNFKKDTEKAGQKAIGYYQDYLATKLPVCGLSYTDYVRVWGKSDYSQCLEKRDKLRQPLMDGNIAMNKMTNSRIEFNVKFAELLSYAPSTDAWRELCTRKKDVDRSFRELSEEVTGFAEKSLKKVIKEEQEQEEANKTIDKMLGLFKSLMAALEALITAIVNIFAVVLKGLSGFAKFMAKYPWAIPIVGGGVALGVGAFIFRPYIGLLKGR